MLSIANVAATSFVAKSKTVNDWQLMLCYTLHEAIKHLENATQRVNVLDTGHVLRNNKCKMCSVFKLYQIVF